MDLWRQIAAGRCVIVAEIGSNHDGSAEKAYSLVAEAARAGADAVKFQVYRGERLVASDEPALPHVRGEYPTQLARFKSLELPDRVLEELVAQARALGLGIMASPFDEERADFLEPLTDIFKIASGELTNLALIRHVAAKAKPVIISTGMATIAEIERAAGLVPREHLALLHCTSLYPTEPRLANLTQISRLKERFDVPVGYSDHTMGSLAPLAALALGASIIEKHFTLNKGEPMGDHRLSAEPDDLRTLIAGIRAVEEMLTPHTSPVESDDVRRRMRRGLYAAADIPAGAAITEGMLESLRPLRGLGAEARDEVLGRRTKRNLAKGEPVSQSDLE